MAKQAAELLLGWTTIALICFSDQAKPFQCDACEINGLDRYRQAVHSRRVRNYKLDRPNVHTERDRTRAIRSPSPAKLYQPLAV